MRSQVVMIRVPHERGVAAAPPRTVLAPDGPCLLGEEPAAVSSVCPTSGLAVLLSPPLIQGVDLVTWREATLEEGGCSHATVCQSSSL